MSTFKPFPKIGSIKDAQYTIGKNNKRTFSHLDIGEDGSKIPVFIGAKLPVLEFSGTVKLHGTNACVIFNSDETVDAQSRTRILSIDADNAGFCAYVTLNTEQLKSLFSGLLEDYFSLHVFGEWCGENIQSTVALVGIPKTFVIFGILATPHTGKEIWLPKSTFENISNKDINVRNIYEFETKHVTLDFNNLSEGMKLVDQYRDDVDAVCPVAKALGSTAENTYGEGHVWRCVTEGYNVAFKHKGESHNRKVRMPKPQKLKTELTDVQLEKLNEFMINHVTSDRLGQGLESLQERFGDSVELTKKHTGDYIKWVVGDIFDESKVDITHLLEFGIDWDKAVKLIAMSAKTFFLSHCDKV